jgi:hypothetical protein
MQEYKLPIENHNESVVQQAQNNHTAHHPGKKYSVVFVLDAVVAKEENIIKSTGAEEFVLVSRDGP